MIGFLLLNPNLKAKEHKLELGIGVASLVYPDYIGSKSYQTIPLVFPYIEYYTPYLSIDKNGNYLGLWYVGVYILKENKC
jgi:hypothetical protein